MDNTTVAWNGGSEVATANPVLLLEGLQSETVLRQTNPAPARDLMRSDSLQSDEGVDVADSHDSFLGIGGEDYPDADHAHSMDSSDDEMDMRHLRNRLESYKTWPVSCVSPTSLAATGFYYTGIADRVRCTFCGGILAHWTLGDDPAQEHRRLFPNCIMNRRNVIAAEEIRSPLARVESAGEDFGGFPILRDAERDVVNDSHAPAFPQMMAYRDRFATFADWSVDKRQQPRDLAMAGWFYTGESDVVQCFDCGHQLEQWDTDDVPWIEHARWSPNCRFVIDTKGQEFIDEVQEQYTSEGSSSGFEDSQGSPARSVSLDYSPSDEDLEEAVVSAALQRNCDMNFIVEALQEHRENFPFARFRTVDELVEAVEAMKNRKRLQKEMIEKAKQEMSKPAPPPPSEDDLKREYERLRNERRCKVCLDKDSQIVFAPCGHLACCEGCSPAMDKCPVCRENIISETKVYFT